MTTQGDCGSPGEPGAVTVRLAYRGPLGWQHMLGFLQVRAIPGVEDVVGSVYRRTLRLPHGHGVLEAEPSNSHVECRLRLADLRDLAAAVQRCMRLFDLDHDPSEVDQHLAGDPLLRELVLRSPGVRVPGTVDGSELALRAVLGQQVSVAAARTTAARLTIMLGEPLPTADGGLTHLFPSADAIARTDPANLPGPHRRRQTLQTLARAIANGEITIDAGSDRDETRSQLLALCGIGSWTAEYVAMRALADPDAFLPTDLGVKRSLTLLGQPADPRDITQVARRWRPWRAYALQHLWTNDAPATLSRVAVVAT
jgi:AraC family transcriptional regulator of adaptative response / DNA-3-methyladenine glycosylase II